MALHHFSAVGSCLSGMTRVLGVLMFFTAVAVSSLLVGAEKLPRSVAHSVLPSGSGFYERQMKPNGALLSSGGYVIPEKKFISNLFTTITNREGYAKAKSRLPRWQAFMKDNPIVLGVWYHVDGGGNLHSKKTIWFSNSRKDK